MLRKYGHDVKLFVRQSDSIRSKGKRGELIGGVVTPWNFQMTRAIKRAVRCFCPDVVHVHNTFPLISPGIFHAIGSNFPRVVTLHNYRLFCPAGIPMRDGKICIDCLRKRNPLPALYYGCYRDSHIATVPLALSVVLHRAIGTWTRQVEAFIALSDFQRGLMSSAGLPLAKVHVKPNFFPEIPEVITWKARHGYVVFVGRLSQEKGLVCLLQAWAGWGPSAPELRIVGEGNLRPTLEKMASGLPVRVLGQMPGTATQAQIAGANLLVLPSECFEGFPMVVPEAFAFGTPVAVSNLGPLPSIVSSGENGLVFEPSTPNSLLEVVRSAWQTPGLLERLGQHARAEFKKKYTEDVNYSRLIKIYESAIGGTGGNGSSFSLS
ncbi:glycosyltransferase family 4 protein [Thiorhodovibrio litoralis]|uniref:glycosyltransferase family 4 protein n=1 Tax=Thiorhodovibrio litoralis TaxID=2952932 RepID=UPI002B25E2F5|nr:glycosyltransferase family 4 protein [Thiorhodovibrio litoralis]WPL10857.1 Glycosyltransferase KanE [Thiorhodovibrio litoralis]